MLAVDLDSEDEDDIFADFSGAAHKLAKMNKSGEYSPPQDADRAAACAAVGPSVVATSKREIYTGVDFLSRIPEGLLNIHCNSLKTNAVM